MLMLEVSGMFASLATLNTCISMWMGESKWNGWTVASGAPVEIADWSVRLALSRQGLNPDDFLVRPSDDHSMLFSQLEAGDRAWLPRVSQIPGVGLQYTYQRRSDDPHLTLLQIKALIQNPPQFSRELLEIRALLDRLRGLGIRIVLGMPRSPGAAAEWDHSNAVLRIKADVPLKGSLEFLRVLNHESIHVAQSCSSGSVSARPTPLHWHVENRPGIAKKLNLPLYAGLSAGDRQLEVEAYGYQNQAMIGIKALTVFCKKG